MTEKPKPQLPISGPILVIDDDEEYRKNMRELFKSTQNAVILLDSAAHAIRFLQNQPWNWRPALALTDLVMDGMGGYEFIRRVHELYPELPVIVVSQLNTSNDMGEAEIAGASAYITKPVEEEPLFDTINNVFQKKTHRMIVFNHAYKNRKRKRKNRL